MGRVQWILSRPLYRFGRFDLRAVPAAQRERALGLQVRQWSPFRTTGTYTIWRDGEAMVYAWDAELLTSSVQAQGMAPASVQVIPETLLHSVAQDGSRLQSCLDGFEGQAWRNQTLVASRWWPRLPNAAEWSAFERDAGLGPDEQSALPTAAQAGWLESPWARNELGGERPAAMYRNERFAVAAGIIILALTTSWYAVTVAKLTLARDGLVRELNELQQRARPIQEARSQALDALAKVSALQSVMAHPDQLSVMAKAAERLAPTGAVLKEWDYRSGKLKITLAVGAKAAASSDYVKAFQQEGLFENVQAVPATGQGPGAGESLFALTMDVKPHVPIVFDRALRPTSTR